jgi:N-acetylglucosaminyldiphosphoundecaprenol N-acetyl-beta-D-mannosaminyltransferase
MGATDHARRSPAVDPRAVVLGCAIDRVTLLGAVERCEQTIAGRQYMQHMAINAAKLVAMRKDRELEQVIQGCELVTADGQAIVWASHLLGDPLPERVAGIDLMESLLESASRNGYRVYILGARQEVLEQAVARLHERFANLRIVGYRNGYFSDEQESSVVDQIIHSQPDILLVAISSPRKELFLGRHGPRLGVPFVMGVGGAIDVVSGMTQRAPALMQRVGLEWLFRLMQEPRRLFRRYAVTNLSFIGLLAGDVLKRHFTRGSANVGRGA